MSFSPVILPAVPTINDGDAATPLLTSLRGANALLVAINGVLVSCGDKMGPCYVSADGGVTAVDVSSISEDVKLHWNGSLAGYQLAESDQITITPVGNAASKHKVVIVLHGIRDRGKWQKDLAPKLAREGFIPELFDYGWFSAIPFLIPQQRRKKVEWFRDKYERLQAEYPGAIPSIIAHSFGTYLVCRAGCDRSVM